MSATPRTDAHIKENGPEIAGVYVGANIHPDFARELERERNELRQMLLKTTGCLGLLIGGAGRDGPAYKVTYEAAKVMLFNASDE